MPRPRQKAVEYLLCLIRNNGDTKNPCLPSIRAMARDCSVSLVTMWKAVHALAEKGFLTVGAHRGVSVAALPDPLPRKPFDIQAAVPAKKDRAALLTDEISHDILSGRYRAGTLIPSAKELCRTYKVCHATLKKALAPLESSGRLVRSRRGYAVFDPPAVSSSSSIILIGRKTIADILSDMTPRVQELWRLFDSGCRKMNISLRVLSWDEFMREKSRPEKEPVLGYVVRDLDMEPKHLDRLFMELRQRKKPAAIIDELGLSPTLGLPKGSDKFQVLSIANSAQAAEELARHLLALGHRRIAFFAPYTAPTWSRNRAKGLIGYYNRAGSPDAVSVFMLRQFHDDWALRDAITGTKAYRQLMAALSRYGRATDPLHNVNNGAFARDPAFSYIQRLFLRSRMKPLFEKALLDRTITAWVGVTDEIAALALDFLEERRIAAPKRLSVAGFDDSFEALSRSFCSYNFNLDALVLAALQFILGRGPGRVHHRVQSIEIPGMLMARESTGKAE